MPEVFYVATLVMCLHGECTKFESAPYSRDISIQNCAKIIEYVFQTQAGPHYVNIIDFSKDKPEDIKIQYAGCDTTQRRPEDIDGKEWRLEKDIDPTPYTNNPNDLRWQQEQEKNIR